MPTRLFGSNVHLPCGDIALGCTIYGVIFGSSRCVGICGFQGVLFKFQYRYSLFVHDTRETKPELRDMLLVAVCSCALSSGQEIASRMAPPTDTDGGCPEPFDTILFVDVDPCQRYRCLAQWFD